MDWELKAALTAGAVMLVMTIVRWGGRRLGGFAAAMPIITAPTLAWLAEEEGLDFAVKAVIGSVAACAMLATFAVGYARASRSVGALASLAAGLVAAGTVAWPARWASDRLIDALALAVVCGVVAMAVMPKSSHSPDGGPTSLGSIAFVSVVAAAVSAVASSVGPAIGGFATGLLSSLPLITAAVAMAEHARSGHRAASRFLTGYVGGLFGKVLFGVVFATIAPWFGVLAAMLLGCAAAALMSGLQWRWQPLEPAAIT